MRKVLLRLWLPACSFLGCLLLAFFARFLWSEVEAEALSLKQKLLSRPVLIALWLTGAWCLARLIDLFLWDSYAAATHGRAVPRLLKDLVNFVVFAIAVACIIAFVFEQPITGFWATSGVVGLVLGLALRNVILDLFTGLAINLDHSLRIGDWVEIHHPSFKEAVYGKVMQINWRTIRLELENRNTVVVPNGTMAVTPFTNYSLADGASRFEVSFTLDFSVPAERAIRILLAGVKAAIGPNGPLETPEPRVLVGEAVDSGVKYRVRYFIRVNEVSPSLGRHTVTKSILEHLGHVNLAPAGRMQNVFHAPMAERGAATAFEGNCRDVLSRVELFQHSLHAPEREALAEQMHLRHYKAGDVLLKQGEPGASLFVLAEGLLYVYIDHGTEHGRLKVAQITPGETFGEMSPFTGDPRSATVTAATDVVAFEILKEHIQELFAQRAEIAERIGALVAERRMRSVRAMADASHEERVTEKQNLYEQIMGKMRRFFSWGEEEDGQ